MHYTECNRKRGIEDTRHERKRLFSPATFHWKIPMSDRNSTANVSSSGWTSRWTSRHSCQIFCAHAWRCNWDFWHGIFFYIRSFDNKEVQKRKRKHVNLRMENDFVLLVWNGQEIERDDEGNRKLQTVKRLRTHTTWTTWTLFWVDGWSTKLMKAERKESKKKKKIWTKSVYLAVMLLDSWDQTRFCVLRTRQGEMNFYIWWWWLWRWKRIRIRWDRRMECREMS